VWQPGVLTLAATKGYWLLIEDIDKVPLEVVSAMVTLLESRQIPAPLRPQGTYETVHPAFRIFGTRTLQSQRRFAGSGVSLISQHNATEYVIPSLKQFSFLWHFVSIPSPTASEIREIITTRFQRLIPAVISKLIETFNLFSSDSLAAPAASSSSIVYKVRKFTLRDLMKVADRIQRNLGGSFNVDAGRMTDTQARLCVTEMIEVYASSMRDRVAFRQACVAIGRCWNVNGVDVDTYILNGCPELSTGADTFAISRIVSIGRISVELTTMNVESGADSTIRADDDGSSSSGKKRSNSGTLVKNVASSSNLALTTLSITESSPTLSSHMAPQFAYSKYSRRLLEQVAACVTMSECVLLVGETGSGKTTSVQQLATLLGRKLVVQNLSLSTDSNDLIGGYRPVSVRQLMMPTFEKFMALFLETFEGAQNKEYLEVVANYMRQSQWKKLIKAFLNASANAMKRMKQANVENAALITRWTEFINQSQRLQANVSRIEHGFAFAHVDGLLVEAMRHGHWLLLDEINLATSETLQALAGILDGQSRLCYSDRGDAEPVVRHPSFRVFAAMNPPTDVGKKELPLCLRCRFTEIYTEELVDHQDLCLVVQRYLQDINDAPIEDIVNVYLGCRASSDLGAHSLVDGAGQRPRYSLRSLTRSLRATLRFLQLGIKPLNKALFEGFILNFQTLLGDISRGFMRTYLAQSFNVSASFNDSNAAPPSRPGGKKSNPSDWVLVKPFWLHSGPLAHINWGERDAKTGITRFVTTKTIESYIRDLTAAVAADVAPVLLQGPTSVGKTTMIEYLAARTGHRCVRINNHEHTEVAEYIGGYVTNVNGQLEFKDGLLVEALRHGHWIIL
jgi:midasin